MTPYEDVLEVNSANAVKFHSMLYFPSGTALHYPGYVVALEKSPQQIIGGPKVSDESKKLFHADATYFKAEQDTSTNTSHQIKRFQQWDTKAMFVSHILKNGVLPDHDTGYMAKSHCFVYNAYAADALANIRKDYDLKKVSDWNACDASRNLEQTHSGLRSLYQESAQALKSLEQNLTRDLTGSRYTHVIVVVMGWNTAQDEAIRNINDITGNLMAAAYEVGQAQKSPLNRAKAVRSNQVFQPTAEKGIYTTPKTDVLDTTRFRPLVIGVTWPSFWSNSFTNFFSYGNKANDADEIGLTWLNMLVNQTVPNALAASKSNAKVVTIGHSFGARAMMRALFSSPALAPQQAFPQSHVNLAVGLQGAVSINRFTVGDGKEGAPYRDFAKLQNTHIALTASEHDGAAGGPVFWYDPSGSIKSWNLVCGAAAPASSATFDCLKASDTSASPNGLFSLCKVGDSHCTASTLSRGKVSYIDASDGITQFNSPGSGGGAHSDIYRLPMGRLLWRLIEQYAPSAESQAETPLAAQ
ncbi:alpha/beta hydrolase [Pseudomonas entomophila]|uniref:alpha/beta hydrolase n=1 Tax=Pseudomonas entomophila TaxID=312306 RepID=UPI001BCE251E|nr:alpha/beta hydrolase [Pseudomonas entomophila]QVM93995.1 alpha/beta hydrolase [Pseudomonas entomophila]